MSPAPNVWTREQVLALPDDGNRYELVDGELLVSPSPRGVHQRAVGELYLLLGPYVRSHKLGYAAFSPADLDLRSGQLMQPDLFVGELVNGREPVDWSDYVIPLLVVEVASPSTARYDRITKRRRFQRSGVPTYWIVDPDARLVEVWTPAAERPQVIQRSLVWRPRAAVPPFTVELPRYFKTVWAE